MRNIIDYRILSITDFTMTITNKEVVMFGCSQVIYDRDLTGIDNSRYNFSPIATINFVLEPDSILANEMERAGPNEDIVSVDLSLFEIRRKDIDGVIQDFYYYTNIDLQGVSDISNNLNKKFKKVAARYLTAPQQYSTIRRSTVLEGRIDEDDIYFKSDKKAYYKNSDNLVSSKVYFWHDENDSGNITAKKITEYVNGSKNGKDIHYSPEGIILLTCNFKKNLLNGPIRINHPNGAAKCITHFENHKKNGDYIEFNSSGVLIHKSFFKNGKRHGEFKNFNDNGQLIVHMFYHEGQKHGECKEYDSEGNLELDCTFKDGSYHGSYKEYVKGNLVVNTHYS